MNNNRNNRRRGRGNRNQGGGGNQSNRIDSRARGNAPQLLDKYKKLAEDAHRNGDRVQAEYYLQFADHYFRVIADNRSRQDEQRGGRRDERDDDYDSEDEDEGEDRRRQQSRRDRPRRDNGRDDQSDDSRPVEANEGTAFEPDDNPFVRDQRPERAERPERPKRRAAKPRQASGEDGGIDAAALPPSLSANDAGDDGEDAKPAPRRRRKRADGSTLSAVG